MTKKTYLKVAKIIHTIYITTPIDELPEATYFLREVSQGLADMFREDNPLFDRERFMRACGFNRE